jgi:hypothetical protein
MSAYIVDKTHVDILVKLGLEGPRGLPVSPGNAWSRLHWYELDPSDDDFDWKTGSRQLELMSADAVGQMLVCENVLSIRARYPDVDEGGTAPGPCDEYWREPYTYADPRYRPTAVEGLQALACFEYQSCEHDEWRTSEARRFCEALRHSLIQRLPGMNDAPWSWNAEEIRAARRRAQVAA